jgi:hypothetical protein
MCKCRRERTEGGGSCSCGGGESWLGGGAARVKGGGEHERAKTAEAGRRDTLANESLCGEARSV